MTRWQAGHFNFAILLACIEDFPYFSNYNQSDIINDSVKIHTISKTSAEKNGQMIKQQKSI